MENRGLVNRKALSTAIDYDLYNRLKKYSEETKIPFSKLLDNAVAMYLESLKR